MAPPPERNQAGPGPLQPLIGHVPEHWLHGVANAEARGLAELTADRELLDRLMWEGYAGPDYERFADRLARYGYAVVNAWCLKGLIFSRCADKGWTLPRARITPDDATELAAETVTIALVKFRETVLIPRKWDPAKGASLNTFFVGQCLLRFLNVYRRWHRETRPLQLAEDPDTDPSFERADPISASTPSTEVFCVSKRAPLSTPSTTSSTARSPSSRPKAGPTRRSPSSAK